MAKTKYTDSRITEIVALLDEKDGEPTFLFDDGSSISVSEVVEQHLGDVVQIKFTKDLDNVG